jgi:hypothetical protein
MRSEEIDSFPNTVRGDSQPIQRGVNRKERLDREERLRDREERLGQ